MRIAIVTDAWKPQVNGVVNTYLNLEREAEAAGFSATFVTPLDFYTVPLPTYPEIRLALARSADVARHVERARADYVHIATEGSLGLAARRYCLRESRPFTTSYHTRFPEYVRARVPIPLSLGYRFERWFHNAGAGVMAASRSLCEDLERHRIRNVKLWSRGVDLKLFKPSKAARFDLPRPIFLYAGRVAVEKNLDAFLKIKLPGTKVVVGGGPQLEALRERYPEAVFTGPKYGSDLADAYASADVFVFPSRTDTFGNVILEALACGVPVAAYNVMGPKDIVVHGEVGVLADDLEEAALAALSIDRERCRAHAEAFSWSACAARFREIIVDAHRKEPAPGANFEPPRPHLVYNLAVATESDDDPADD